MNFGEKVLVFSLVEIFGDAFDTKNSARGYLSTGGSQSKQLRLETRENVDKNEFDSILKRLANPKKADNLEKPSKVVVVDDDDTLPLEQIQEIKRLLFTRVEDGVTRSKIYQVAEENGRRGSADYWATIYHYSLSENWPDLEEEFNYIFGGSQGNSWTTENSETEATPTGNRRSGLAARTARALARGLRNAEGGLAPLRRKPRD